MYYCKINNSFKSIIAQYGNMKGVSDIDTVEATALLYKLNQATTHSETAE